MLEDPVRHETARDAGGATALLTAGYGHLRLDDVQPGAFRYAEHRFADGRIDIARVHLGFSAEAEAPAVGENGAPGIVVVQALSGRWDWRAGDEAGDGVLEPVLVQVGERVRARVAAAEVLTVRLELAALEAFAGRLYGERSMQVRFASHRLRDPRSASLWRDACRQWAAVLAEPDDLVSPLFQAALRRHAAVSTMELFAMRGDREVRTRTAAATALVFRRATEFMHSAASLPITVEDIAAAAGVPGVDLERAFLLWADRSPGDYLRSVRLLAAHEDLVRAEPGSGVDLRTVASRWGFRNRRSFARQHRADYGVDPARLLRG